MIETRSLSKSFGAVAAVRDVSLSVQQGELRGIVGANGAGKSTLFGLIAGQLAPDRGEIRFRDRDITALPPHRRAGLRIAIVFQSARLFRGMTALENVMVGAHGAFRHGFTEAMVFLPRHVREERSIRQRAEEALDRVGLADRAGVAAESLPIGQQRMLQVARALCGEPELLLLDEPASGLRAHERQALSDLLLGLKPSGLTMMLIEHDVAFVNGLADTITVLDLGTVIAEGSPAEIWSDRRVVAAYLGEVAASA
jgi:branched-chain amino acid transport system ATP-binding protein